MNVNFDSTDRKITDYVLFGLAFFSFILGTAGVIAGSPSAAVCGWLVMLLAVLSFVPRRSSE